MPRISTKGKIGEFFHVYNRGVDKRTVFVSRKDYVRFYTSLHLFNTMKPTHDIGRARSTSDTNHPLVNIHAYALLPNHFHLLLEQDDEKGIGEFMRRVSNGYTLHFNEQNSRSGALFQGTYQRVHQETDQQIRYLCMYINENHIVHGHKQPEEICMSSTLHYRNIKKSKALSTDLFLKGQYDSKNAIRIAKEIYKNRKQLKCE